METVLDRMKCLFPFLFAFSLLKKKKLFFFSIILEAFLRVPMGVPSYQLTTNFSANCQLTTSFLIVKFFSILNQVNNGRAKTSRGVRLGH